ncbi:MAG: hypothetical protein RLZZ463_1270 [Bacteroidota bacterium]
MRILVADRTHFKYAPIICDTIEESAKIRGTGIAKRTPEYIQKKMENGNAIIALRGEDFAGFCLSRFEIGVSQRGSGIAQ